MNLITVRPGPVLHIWRGGEEVAAVPLSPSAALSIASDLLAAIVAQAGAPEGWHDLGPALHCRRSKLQPTFQEAANNGRNLGNGP